MKEGLQTREVCDPIWISGSHYKPIPQLHDRFKPHEPITSVRGTPALLASPATPIRCAGTRGLVRGHKRSQGGESRSHTRYLLQRGLRKSRWRVAWGFCFSAAVAACYLKLIVRLRAE